MVAIAKKIIFNIFFIFIDIFLKLNVNKFILLLANIIDLVVICLIFNLIEFKNKIL